MLLNTYKRESYYPNYAKRSETYPIIATTIEEAKDKFVKYKSEIPWIVKLGAIHIRRLYKQERNIPLEVRAEIAQDALCVKLIE